MPINRILISLVAVTLAGCASTGSAPTSPPEPQQPDLVEQVEQRLPHTNPDVLYYVGAAEISGMREQFQLSAELYSRAAALSEDPAIAAQSVKVAAFANDEELTLRGVARWLALQPDHPEPHRIAAILYLRRGDADNAWNHIRAVLDTNPPVERWDATIKMVASTNDRGTGLSIYQRIAEGYEIPHSEAIRQALSDLGVQLGDLETAERFATAALEVNDQNAATYNWRGRLRTSLGRLEDAKADFEKAIELDPENDQMRQSYAALLADLEDYEGAIAQLEEVEDTLIVVFSKGIYALEADLTERAEQYYLDLQAIEAEDESEKSYFLGQLAESLERPTEETLAWYEQVRSGERMDNARLRSALVMGRNGQMPKARVVLKRLQNGNAQTAARAYLAEAGLLRDDDRKEDALSVYNQALVLLPDNTDLLFARALLAERMDQLDQAEDDLRKVLDLNPDDPNALNALGYTLADRTDRYDEALVLIERALEQMPDEPAFVDSFGWVQYKLGNYETALEHLERALELQYDSEIAAHLGEVLWVLGREDEAQELWAEALDREPDSDILLETVSRFVAE